MKYQNQISNLFQFKINLSLFMCVLFYSYICVCECLLQNINCKTKHKNNTNCGSALEPGASGLPYYCTSICVRFGCTRLARCVDSKPNKKKTSFVYTCVCIFLHTQCPLRECRSIRSGASGLPYDCAPLVCVSAVMEFLAV